MIQKYQKLIHRKFIYNSEDMKFKCVQDCSECCIKREYYPSKRFGKVGVLILPEEKERIEEMAKEDRLEIKILPRIGVSESGEGDGIPTKILAYQMMGSKENGDVCPFLDTESAGRSPHGGFQCKIYKKRPLACTAYPLIESDPITLDQKCKFCKEHKGADGNLNAEIEALLKIKEKMVPSDESLIWRFATGTGEAEDQKTIEFGWIPEI